MRDYEIWHDENKGGDQENKYWHGIFFLPIDKKDELINALKKIRKEYKTDENKDVKFAGVLKNSKTKNAQIVNNNLALFSHLLIIKEKEAKTDIFHRTNKDIYKKQINPYLTLNGIFGCKFVLFFIPNNHKDFTKYPMYYSERVETTFRMGFKGGVHLLFSKQNPINIQKFYFDGNEHHGGKINLERILKGGFREYCSISDTCQIDDSQMKKRDSDSKIIMSFVDNIVGAWSAILEKKIDSGNILYPIKNIHDRLKNNKIILNPNGKWHKSISISKLEIKDEEIIFPDFFEKEEAPRLF